MKVLVQHHVRDFDAWKSAFDEHGPIREKHGCTGHTVYRSGDDWNTVTILTDWPNFHQAQAFATDPSLRAAMEQGGVDNEPSVHFLKEEETSEYKLRRVV